MDINYTQPEGAGRLLLAAYITAEPTVRRLFNQAIFERIWISRENIHAVRLAQPFAGLLASQQQQPDRDQEKTLHATLPRLQDKRVRRRAPLTSAMSGVWLRQEAVLPEALLEDLDDL